MPIQDERQTHILDAAAALIIRLGYDKTTMSDIAEQAGASRRTVYLHFKGKDELFEALLYREYLRYSETWPSSSETPRVVLKSSRTSSSVNKRSSRVMTCMAD